jgi:hypothetical protein
LSLQYYFAQPDYIDNLGEVYPVKLKDYDKFHKYSKILYISKNHFSDTNISLLNLIFSNVESLGFTMEELIISLENLFSLVLKKTTKLNTLENRCWFQTEDSKVINVLNYDMIRSIIMKQNLMFEQKVFKNKKVQEWANTVLEAKSKNQPKIGMEEIVTTVASFTGKHPWDLENYTIYQIYSEFYRIRKLKSFDVLSMARSHGADIEVDDFAEDLDIYKNPYDSLFVSSDKLNKFNK